MQHGTETEPEARAAYEFYQGVTVEEVAFVHHPKIDQAGCSPDGLVGSDGLVEIKCPNTATHLETLLGQAVPGKYDVQMQFQMACTGRPSAISSPTIRGCRKTCACSSSACPATKRIKELESEVAAFLLEMAVKLSQLREST
jgi:hypothetical protein